MDKHVPYVEVTPCEFGDHEYWSCRCDWKHDNYIGGAEKFMEHIMEAWNDYIG